MDEPYNLKVKICLLGDSAVGKTSLIRRYVMDIFDDKYISTLGTKVSKKRIMLKKDNMDIDLTLSIWDVLGQQEFTKIQNTAFKGSKGAFIVCDFTRAETLQNISQWAARLKKAAGDIPMVILANKSDLTGKYTFNENDIQMCSNQLNSQYFITSAKFGDNVIKSFYTLSRLVIDDMFKGQTF
ncbi:Rab family GTPase [[Eubacterium] cellulosolvens]